MGWTAERVELLKKLWANGLSASQVAAELGGVTRSGVIGKVHREKLPGRPQDQPSASRRPPRQRVARPPAVVPQRAYAPPIASEPEPEPEPDLLEVPVEQRKTLLELTAKTCHWPVGDPSSADFYFCGGDAEDERPYCAYHCRVAYQPPIDRRREPAPIRRYPARNI